MAKAKRLFKWWNKGGDCISTGASFVFIKNKAISGEITYSKFFNEWFAFSTQWNRKQDYAGFEVEGSFLWLTFYFQICDTRLWDYMNNCWEPEPIKEEAVKKFSYEWF